MTGTVAGSRGRRGTTARPAAGAIAGVAVFLLAAAPARAQDTTLDIRPITWDVIGLDSNTAATVGPNVFPVAVRVTNTGAATATNLAVTLTFDSANALINGSGPTVLALPSLAPGERQDFYFNVIITRSTAAFDTTRAYHITATADNAPDVSTPLGRQLFVEHLVSQNRNSALSFVGPTTVFLGDVLQYTLTGKTATQGYEQLEYFASFPTDMFRILSVTASYSSPPGATNDTVYADACGWDPIGRT